MTAFTMQQFSGSVPRHADHVGSKGQASKAIDCKFDSGNLDSFRQPLLVREVGEAVASYLHDCCWFDFDGCVDVAYGSATCKEAFVTGYREYPVALTINDHDTCEVTERRLGMPCPLVAPSVVLGDLNDTHERDLEGRSYAYQYVSSLGWKSELSPASKAVNVRDGQTCIISGWVRPDPEDNWDVVSVNIYRTVSGYQAGNEQGNIPDTTWMLVATVDINEVGYVDSLRNDDLYEANEEEMVMPPPDGLRGIIWIENCNALMGFVGNRIYASENNNYHNWPYYYTLDDNVCGLCESDGIVYVATDGAPYILAGKVGCETAGCREIVRLHGRYPMVGCGNRRIAAIRGGVVYPSHKGLVLLSNKTPPAYITWQLYSAEEWQKLIPPSITPVEVDGKLYVFGQGGSFYMKLSNGSESGWNLDVHSSLSDTGVTDAFVTRQGDFYIVKDNKLYLWDKSSELRPHFFKSIEVVTNGPIGWGAGKLVFKYGSERVIIETDGRTVLDRQVLSSREFRLPNYAVGSRTFVTLQGIACISLASIATTMHELGR